MGGRFPPGGDAAAQGSRPEGCRYTSLGSSKVLRRPPECPESGEKKRQHSTAVPRPPPPLSRAANASEHLCLIHERVEDIAICDSPHKSAAPAAAFCLLRQIRLAELCNRAAAAPASLASGKSPFIGFFSFATLDIRFSLYENLFGTSCS